MTTTNLALIAAVADNGVIGGDNRLLWRLPEDMKHFKALTTGHSLIMGRKTWDSLGRALPNRQNIVVTRSADTAAITAGGGIAVRSIDEALATANLPAPIFCIGGGELYRQMLPLADTLYLTRVHANFDGDTHFPELNPEQWRRTTRDEHQNDDFAYAFETWVKK
jgi:dihydrofolate reductase